jgi:hypothetical protein
MDLLVFSMSTSDQFSAEMAVAFSMSILRTGTSPGGDAEEEDS